MSHRVTATVDDDTFERLKYWSKKHGVSINVYLNDAIDTMIQFENHDYDLPTAEVQRLNQLVDGQIALADSVSALERVIVSGFDSLLGLTKGDNYLLNDEDGDI